MSTHSSPKKKISPETIPASGLQFLDTDPIASTDDTAEILYQKIGDRWYAFSVIEEEVYMGPVAEELISKSVKK